jgi:hypothetical protein
MIMLRLLFSLLLLLSAVPAWASEEIGRQEDTASSSGHVLMPEGCVRQDTLATSTDADGDYAHIKCTTAGRVYTSSTIDAALPSGGNTIGNVGLATGSNTIGNVGINAGANAIGSVTITSSVPGTGATNLGKAEDNAHVSGDTGVMSLCVRHDVSSTGLGVDGDYAPCAVNASGELYTSANTELPAPVALANGTANPTVPGVAAFLMCFNGTTWDRCSPSVTDTDDNSIAFSQSTALTLQQMLISDGTQWVRFRTFLEDTAAAGHDGGQLLLMGAVRQDTIASSTSTDGDYSNLKTDSFGALWMNCRTGCAGGTQYNEDVAAADANTGTIALAVRQDTPSSSTSADGDFTWLKTDSIGRLWINCGAGCGSTQYAEDVISTGGESMTLAGSIRQDTPAGTTSADGDYQNLKTDSVGRLWVNCGTGCSGGTQYAEDTVGADADVVTLAGAQRQDAIASNTSADGDRTYLKVNNVGRLYTAATIDAAIPAGSNTIGNVNPGTATNWGVYVEDLAETAGGNLMMAGSVRRDTPNTSTNADGDNATINTDALGKLWVTGSYIEDFAETAGGVLSMAGAVRRDTLASSSGTSGDNSTINTTSDGALWVAPVAATNGGTTPCYLSSAATTNSTNCKASAGQLYGFDLMNTTTTVYYLRLYNLSTAPTCSSSTGFIRSIPVPPASVAGGVGGVVRDLSLGETYGTGLGFCLTGGGGSTDNTSAATGVYITLQYR